MHCTIFPVYRSILKGKVARMLKKKKIEHNLIDEHLKKKNLPAIYLTNELTYSTQRASAVNGNRIHLEMNDCFASYSARIFFVQNFFKYKC